MWKNLIQAYNVDKVRIRFFHINLPDVCMSRETLLLHVLK